MGALKAPTKPGDKITAVSTADGGHISHARMGAIGEDRSFTYPWVRIGWTDIDAAAELIRDDLRPWLCLDNQSSYSQLLSKTSRMQPMR